MMGYGYENAAGDRISALIDMINGGGPGRSGGTFEGGGILSLLANAVAKPYGSVRERPGHTPMGAVAAPMDVLRPVARPVATGASVAPVETTAFSESQPFERSFETEAAAPRYLTEDEAARLAELDESIAPPDLLSFFNGLPAGAPLSPQESMILDALLASASFNPEVQARRGLNRVSTAPSASLRPKLRPDAGITIPPYTLALQDQPVAEPSTAPLVSLRPKLRPDAALTFPAPTDAPSDTFTFPPTADLTFPAPTDAPSDTFTFPPLQGRPIPPLVPSPTDIPTAPATAYESLGEPTLFTQDQLDAMSPEMRRMAEEHNRENAPLVAEAFRVPAFPLVSLRPKPRPDGLGSEPAGIPAALPAAETAALFSSLRPKPRPAAPLEPRPAAPLEPRPAAPPAAETAGADTLPPVPDGATRVPFGNTAFDVIGNRVFYARDTKNAFAGDELPSDAPRHDVIIALSLLAGKDGPTRVPFGDTAFDVFPDGTAVYAKDGRLALVGDPLTPIDHIYDEVIKLAAQRR
jgi:hypothetical protein